MSMNVVAVRGRSIEPLYYFKTLTALEAVDVEVAYIYRKNGAAAYLIGEPDDCGIGKISIQLCIAGKYDGDLSVGSRREFHYPVMALGKPIEQSDLAGSGQEITRLDDYRAWNDDLSLKSREKRLGCLMPRIAPDAKGDQKSAVSQNFSHRRLARKRPKGLSTVIRV